MTLTALAFFTGLFASLHCVAMCGPLMMALPFSGRTAWYILLWQRLLYQAGRILTYAVLGALMGVAGKSITVLGFQQGLSILSGLLLIVIAVFQFSKGRIPGLVSIQAKFTAPVTRLLARYFAKPYGSFVAGALNGLIPCGIVYMALATALSSGSVAEAARFMTFFGIGTTPLLLLSSVLPVILRKAIKPRLSTITPIILLVTGSWLFIRGLNVDIPHLVSRIDISAIPFCN
ncbi:MAG TPA: sulfite exporter TauE/SafE family protein [Sphingobacteriaceae bacterium]